MGKVDIKVTFSAKSWWTQVQRFQRLHERALSD
jgi:hypothetical protein